MCKREGDVQRPTWGGKFEFFLSCVGYTVAMGNIWRFPYLCMRNGGGAFLIPYTLSIFLCGMPLFFIELAIGQFSSRSPTEVWNFCPILKGLGWAAVIISSSIVAYDIIMTWVLYYLFKSFAMTLPWSTCGNKWNTDRCQELQIKSQENGSSFNEVLFIPTDNSSSATYEIQQSSNHTPVAAGEEFFERKVLQLSSGIEHIGGIKFDILFFFALSWVITFACMFKGIKSSGKVIYVTAILPYILLIVLIIRGMTLPGAMTGIAYFLKPDFNKLLDINIWVEANIQTFMSLGVGFGGILTFASYNNYNHKFYREAMLVPVINHATSILGGFAIFSVIGFIAKETGHSVDEVIKSGPGLAFVVYPEALSKLPFAPFWAVLFFVTLAFVGIDSSFGQVETVASGLEDAFPKLRKYKIPFTACLIFCMFLLGLPFTTKGGMYMFQLYDWYYACLTLFIIGFMQCVGVVWIYGHDRFYYDISCMLGNRPSIIWKIMCGGVAPIVILISFIYTVSSLKEPYYGSYTYPGWAISLGWLFAVSSLFPIPVCAVMAIQNEEGTWIERLRKAMQPNKSWGPALIENRKAYKYTQEYTGVPLL